MRPLEPRVRERLESRFGQDLSLVRLHSGRQASVAAARFGARAFACGADIYFRDESWDERLLVHEVAHVVQFLRARSFTSFVGSSDTTFEHEADTAADAVLTRECCRIAAHHSLPLIQLTPQRPHHAARVTHPGIVTAGTQRHVTLGLPPLRLNFRHVDVSSLFRPLPTSVSFTDRSYLLRPIPPPSPHGPLTISSVNVDTGMNLVGSRGSFTQANPNDALAGEIFLSLVYQFDGYSTPNHRWDFFHQPTLTGTIGTNILGGSSLAYRAASLSVVAVNHHFLDTNGADLVEVALLNLGASIQDGNPSVTGGVGAEFHVDPRWSLTVNASVNLNPTSTGVEFGGGVSVGVLYHHGPITLRH